jgi:light-regulated signal transduction histidine kinase (bacteriophytochrome)
VRKDGRVVFTNLSVGCVRRADRSVDYVLAMLEDITGRKESDEQIRRLNVQLATRAHSLEQANKELESFSYSVSHDLRAPLRSIDGFSRIVLEDCADRLDVESRENLQRVRSASQRMGHLIDDILRLARLTRAELRRTPVDLSALARAVSAELRSTEPKRQVQFIIAPNLVAEADDSLMRAVMENLLGNAWKFTSKQPDAKIEFGCTSTAGVPTYFVRDNGVGFDMQHAAKLFSAFTRLHVDAEFPGSGIGLASVQRIIHRHGGRVWATGEVGKGATCYFTLMLGHTAAPAD